MLPLLLALLTLPLPPGFHPQTSAAGDFDGDHRADIALCGQSGQLLILRGDPLRAVPQSASCGEHPIAMIAAGSDLVVANHETSYVTFLHNDGHAHFSAQRVRRQLELRGGGN